MSGLRRQWWALCAGIIAGVAIGVIVFVRTEPVYASTASVLVQAVDATAINLQTEAVLVRSTDVAAAAAVAPDGRLADVEAQPNTSILDIRFEAPTPAAAQAGALAYANAYLQVRSRAARAGLEAQLAAYATKIEDARAQLATVNSRIRTLPSSSPELTDLKYTASTLENQIALLAGRASELTTVAVTPGRVVGAPPLPSAPVRPDAWLYLPISVLAGVIAGALLAFLHEHASRRIHHGVEVTRRHALPVLMELTTGDTTAPTQRVEPVTRTRPVILDAGEPYAPTPGSLSLASSVFGPAYRDLVAGVAGAAYVDSPRPTDPIDEERVSPRQQHWTFNRMRNEIVAALGTDDRVLLVVGASAGAASTVVAANLAAAFARADIEVVLVGANAPVLGDLSVTLSHIFDVADIPGLSDVLTGRASLSRALQRAARAPRLRVITPGGTATASGLLQAEGARGALYALRRMARFVVVDAPSAAISADAQSLAACADAAVIVVEAGQTRHSQLADTTAQLRLVGTRVLGVAIIGKSSPGPAPDVPPFRPAPPIPPPPDVEGAWAAAARHALEAPTTQLPQLEASPAPAQMPS